MADNQSEYIIAQIRKSAPNLVQMINDDDNYGGKKFVGLKMISYWQKFVIENFLPKIDELTRKYDQEIFQALLEPICRYIAKNDDYRTVFEQIRQTVPGPTICGKVFVNGEPIYTCVDCAHDATCVLCVECFKHSEHRFHEYRMIHGSSGCCDCGDTEAWSKASHCSHHLRDKLNPEQTRANLDKIFGEVNDFERFLERMKIAFTFMLDYSYSMLSWDNSELPNVLKSEEDSEDESCKCYATALYNDETHTYDHVVMALQKAIHCKTGRATDIANVVDHEGRCLIYRGTKDECQKVATTIIEHTLRSTDKPLVTKVFHIDVIAHQNFAICILNWLRDLLAVCEEYREVYSQHMFRRNHTTEWLLNFTEKPQYSTLSLVEKIIRSDTYFWKFVRVAWQKQIMNGLMMDMEIKKKFSRLYVRNFQEIMHDYMKDDHDNHLSVVSFAVQIFTVPSISLMLIEEENVIERILGTFLELTRNHHANERFRFSRSQRETAQFRRIITAFDSLSYVFDRPVDSSIWNSQLRTNFIKGFNALLHNLILMQATDSVVRQIDRHVEFEPSLEHGIHLQMSLSPIMKSMAVWASSDQTVFHCCLRMLFETFKKYFEAEKTKKVTRFLGSESFQCYDYDISSREVSFHIPLSRLISHFAIYVNEFKDWFDFERLLNEAELNFDALIEYPLRVQVLIAQFRSGMWRRNGTALANHLMYLQVSHNLRESTLDADYILLQVCAAFMDPDHFLIAIMNKFSINFLIDENEPLPKADEEIHQLNSMIEEFFKLLYTVLVERYVLHIGDVTNEDIIQYEAVQWLCISPMSNSKLKDNLNRPKCGNLDDTILGVADFIKPKNSTKHGEYQLKESALERFNPFFFRFSSQDKESAYVEQAKRKKLKGDKYICCPPPELPNFLPILSKITDILMCDVMFAIIQKILIKTCDLTDTLYADAHFQHILYMIGIGLREQSKRPKEFQFVEKCTEWGLFALLEQCNGRHILPRIKAHQDLLGWTFDQVKVIQQLVKPEPTEGSAEAMEVDENVDQSQKDEELKAMRRQMALEVRMAMVAKIKKAQTTFLKENEEYLKDKEEEKSTEISSAVSMNDLSDRSSEKNNNVIALGKHQDIVSRRNHIVEFEKKDFTCILCLESRNIQSADGLMVVLGYCQKSTVIRMNESDPDDGPLSKIFIDSGFSDATYVGGCGHLFHFRCFQKHIDQLKVRDRTRSMNRPRRNYNEKKGEFICPMCKAISNLMVPIMRPTKLNSEAKFVDYPMPDWLTDMHHLATGDMIDIIYPLTTVQEMEFNNLVATRIDERSHLKIALEQYKAHRQPNFLRAVPSQDKDTIVDSVVRCFMQIFDVKNSSLDPNVDEMPEPSTQIFHYLTSIYHVIANSIQVFERSLRQNLLTYERITESILFTGIRALVEIAKAQFEFYENSQTIRQAVYYMKYLLDGTFYQTVPRSVLDVDAFGLFVSLLFSVPSIFSKLNERETDFFTIPLGNAVDHNCFLLMFTFHLVQIILTNVNICDPEDDTMDTDEKPSTTSSPPDHNLAQFCVDILTAAGQMFDKEAYLKNCSLVSDRIRAKMLPFLRSSAVFAHLYTGIAFPKRFLEESISVFPEHALAQEEFEQLCNYLGISSGLCFLGISNLKSVAVCWAKHPSIQTYFELNSDSRKPVSVLRSEFRFLQQSHPVRRLAVLPNDFSELVNRVAYFKCPNTNVETKYPTLCLICETILCSQNYCCQEKKDKDMLGPCMRHIMTCGKGAGIFLRVRDCRIMLLAPQKGRYLPAPYVDKYGETDQGLKRGSPLFLCHDSYQKIHEYWFRHQVPELIVQYLEVYNGLTAISWNMM